MISCPLSMQPPDAAIVLADDQPRWLVIAVIDAVAGMKFNVDTMDDYITAIRIDETPEHSPQQAWQTLLGLHKFIPEQTLATVFYAHPHCAHVALLQRLDDWPQMTEKVAGTSMGFSNLPDEDELKEIAKGLSRELSKRRDDPRARNARNN